METNVMKKYYFMSIFLLVFTLTNSICNVAVSELSKKGHPLTKTVRDGEVKNDCGDDMEKWCYKVVVESSNLSGNLILANQSFNCWIESPEIPVLSAGYIDVILNNNYDVNSSIPFIFYLKPQTQTIIDYNIWINQINNLNNN
jgi:hypothetical protein